MLDGIRASSADYLLIMDSDGQSNPDEIINFWDKRKVANIISGNRTNREDYAYRRLYSRIAFYIYKLLFNVPLKDPSYAYALIEKNVYNVLNNFIPQMPDGFFWEFNVRAKNKGFTFYNLDITHKERSYGNTRIFLWRNLPMVSYNNFLGMIKIRFFD